MGKESIQQTIKESMRTYFDSTPDYWNSIYTGDGFINAHMRDRKDFVVNLVNQYSSKSRIRILDLGCGTGVLTRLLVEDGHYVVAADIAQNMIARLMESLTRGPDSSFLGAVIEDAEHTCFGEGAFDAVLCIGVFQYQWRNDLLLQEISRVLTRGGMCIFTIPNILHVNIVFHLFTLVIRKLISSESVKRSRSDQPDNREPAFPYSKKYFLTELNKAILESGLRVRRVVAFGYGPLSIMNKRILSRQLSMKISIVLTELSNKHNSTFLKMFANRWIFVVQKI